MSPLTDQQLLDLAMEHHRAGRLAEAEALYRRLLAVHPREPDVLHLLGVLAGHAGHPQGAVDLIRQAIAINPSSAAYHSNLANSLITLDRLDEAVAACETALRLQPGMAGAHYNLGLARLRQRQWEAAGAACEAALRFQPDYADAHLNLGLAREMQGRLDDAIACFHRGLAHAPRHAVLWSNLGNALKRKGDIPGAALASRTAVECDPRDARLINNFALVQIDRGEIDAAIDSLRRSLALDPAQPEVRSNLIFTAHGLPDGDALIREQLAEWQRLHAGPLKATWQPHANERSPERPLRIGYVSPDFRDHVVGRTLLPVFLAHDRERFDLTCYSEFDGEDAVAAQFRAGAARWRVTAGQSDEQLAAQIRADGIDVLVDLALHTSHNRLLVFARKPAPVQVAWLGYPGTTGLDAIDYAITDARLDPPGLNADYYSEELVRLPDAWCCYGAPADSPEPGELLALASGRVTFGSFNKLGKINARVLALWARILAAVEGSRLLLLAKDEASKEPILEFLGAERVGFLSYQPACDGQSQHEFLRRYQRLDIALDPFPYNGMTTTCDALWMGVPVVALAGKLPVSRAGVSLLPAAGVPELAALSEDDYVRIAVEWARDLPRLAALRASLRGRMMASPLIDARRFARNLEAAFRAMWRHWCAT